MHQSPFSQSLSSDFLPNNQTPFLWTCNGPSSSVETNGFSFCFPSHVGSTASRQPNLHRPRWSSNMSFKHGIMSSLALCNSKPIMVVNGIIITVTYIGHFSLPSAQSNFVLNNILVSNRMVKNFVYFCILTHDNFVSITFDPFDFL